MDPERAGGPDPLERSQKIGFLSNTGPDPLKNRKATRPEFDVMPLPNASETPFKWCFVGGSTMARFKWYFDHLSSHQLKKKRKKNVVKVGTPLKKVS